MIRETNFKKYLHNPPHLFIPGCKYWVTGSAYQHQPFFRQVPIKLKMLEVLDKGCMKFDWQIDDWVILDDHYHLMLQASKDGKSTVRDIIRNFHKFSAMWIRNNYPALKNIDHIFYNYWDTCITYEKSYFARLNYLYFNPVKHGYVKRPEDYSFGSYYYRFRKAPEKLEVLLEKYPFDRLHLE